MLRLSILYAAVAAVRRRAARAAGYSVRVSVDKGSMHHAIWTVAGFSGSTLATRVPQLFTLAAVGQDEVPPRRQPSALQYLSPSDSLPA